MVWACRGDKERPKNDKTNRTSSEWCSGSGRLLNLESNQTSGGSSSDRRRKGQRQRLATAGDYENHNTPWKHTKTRDQDANEQSNERRRRDLQQRLTTAGDYENHYTPERDAKTNTVPRQQRTK